MSFNKYLSVVFIVITLLGCSSNNKIYYKTIDDEPIVLNPIYKDNSSFGKDVHIIDHVYEDGAGVIICNKDITKIGHFIFYNCSNLAEIQIPNTVKTIGPVAFGHCTSLNSISLGNNIESIGRSVFMYCANLTSIMLPKSIKTIGDNAFMYCNSLRSVYCKAATPPSLDNEFPFGPYIIKANLYIPLGSLKRYQNAKWVNISFSPSNVKEVPFNDIHTFDL